MNIKPEHEFYEEDYDSKAIYLQYINEKIDMVEQDLDEFKQIADKEFDYIENSQALEIYNEKVEEVVQGFKDTINEIKSLKEDLK